MGTWGAGPFDNDTAGDFCDSLDEAGAGEREGIVRGALTQVSAADACVDAPEAEEAVAAAALVAAQCERGEPADPDYGPDEPLPDLTALRDLALHALERVIAGPSELMDLWNASDGRPWRSTLNRLQSVLLPPASRRTAQSVLTYTLRRPCA